MLHKYGGSFRKALISVYPTIQFDNDQLFPESKIACLWFVVDGLLNKYSA